MKIKFNSALKAGVIAAALAFSGASYANDFSVDAGGGQMIALGNVKSFDQAGAVIGIAVYTVTSTSTPSEEFLAFCVQPTVSINAAANYTATVLTGSQVDNKVKQLFESSYKSTIGDVNRQMAFQLALWDLTNDDGNMYATSNSGSPTKQYFDASAPVFIYDYAGVAAGMLSLAGTQQVNNIYSYTSFTASNVTSQELLAVTAVPEAETWAMLAAGLGLIGFMGRRQSRRTEKFAA